MTEQMIALNKEFNYMVITVFPDFKAINYSI